MCAIYSLRIILLVNNIRVRNFRCFGWNENFLTTKVSRITVYEFVEKGGRRVGGMRKEPYRFYTLYSKASPLSLR